jgi:glutamate racemase
VIRPGATTAALTTRNRRVGVIATPATIRSHAYFSAIKDENPAVEVYEHATPAFVPMVEAGRVAGPEVEQMVREGLAPLLGERDASGEFVFPLPASARIDTLLLGCTHYPLIRAAIAAATGDRIAIVDSATATASALSELLLINGLEAPGSSRGTAADAGRAGHDEPPAREGVATHQQLTTGDVVRFRAIAQRMFGDEFPDVLGIELGSGAGTTSATALGRIEAVGS